LNVYENKGTVWEGRERGGNVLDNEDCQVFLDSLLRFMLDNKSITQPEWPKRSSKVTERSLNVYENKGVLWKSEGKAGMSKKIKVVSLLYGLCN